EDRVAAGLVGNPLETELFIAALQPRFVGRAAGDDFGHEAAVIGAEAELFGELWVERLGGDADVGVLGAALPFELGERALHGGDRHREADPIPAAARVL